MDAMVVVDMQVGLLTGAPKYDLQAVVERINRLAGNQERLLWGILRRSRHQARTAAVSSVRGPSSERSAPGEKRQ
jgi:hypothetical protein